MHERDYSDLYDESEKQLQYQQTHTHKLASAITLEDYFILLESLINPAEDNVVYAGAIVADALCDTIKAAVTLHEREEGENIYQPDKEYNSTQAAKLLAHYLFSGDKCKDVCLKLDKVAERRQAEAHPVQSWAERPDIAERQDRELG